MFEYSHQNCKGHRDETGLGQANLRRTDGDTPTSCRPQTDEVGYGQPTQEIEDGVPTESCIRCLGKGKQADIVSSIKGKAEARCVYRGNEASRYKVCGEVYGKAFTSHETSIARRMYNISMKE